MRVFVAGATGVDKQFGVTDDPRSAGTVRKRQMPVIDGGTGIWSFTEVTDAASWRPGFPARAEQYTAGQAAHDHAA